MSQDSPSSLKNVVDRAREVREEFKSNYAQWTADARENPAVIWQAWPVRVGFWLLIVIAVLVAVSVIVGGAGAWTGGGQREEATRLATLYVACTDSGCLKSATVNAERNFKEWPMVCEACGKKAVYRARACPKCKEWIAFAPLPPGSAGASGASESCPHCAKKAAAKAAKPKKAAASGPADPDDREDGWE